MPTRLGFVAFAFGFVSSVTAAEPASSLVIHVCVLEYARIPEPVLAKAKPIADRILQHAGVTLDWLPTTGSNVHTAACRGPIGKAVLFLRLVPRSIEKTVPSYPGQFGFAALSEGGFPSNSYIFVDRVNDFAGRMPIRLPVLLGHVLAHELGHLLLGTNSHSLQGIMQGSWGWNETKELRLRGLCFSRGEAQRIRENAEARQTMMVGRDRQYAAKLDAAP